MRAYWTSKTSVPTTGARQARQGRVMKKRFALIAAIVAVLGLGAAVAVANETTEGKTSVKLKYHRSDPTSPRSFSGEVKARQGGQEGRRVLLYGPYHITRGKTNARGKFEIVEDYGRAGRGRDAPRGTPYQYTAVAKETKIAKHNGDKIVCREGRSNTIRFYPN
jgi:hypothetical protein